MNFQSGKIVSRFYVIYGDDNPIYVGYTNRTVKQRFMAHKRYKDFSSYDKVEVKEVDKLEFYFTWDLDTTYENAKIVSNHETSLINRYGTTDSLYQQGFHNIIGGQTWSYIKWFVRNNKNNPKFNNMTISEISTYISIIEETHLLCEGLVNYYGMHRYMLHFIGHTQVTNHSYYNHFVSHTSNSTEALITSMIINTRSNTERQVRGLIGKTISSDKKLLLSTVGVTKGVTRSYISKVVSMTFSDTYKRIKSLVRDRKNYNE